MVGMRSQPKRKSCQQPSLETQSGRASNWPSSTIAHTSMDSSAFNASGLDKKNCKGISPPRYLYFTRQKLKHKIAANIIIYPNIPQYTRIYPDIPLVEMISCLTFQPINAPPCVSNNNDCSKILDIKNAGRVEARRAHRLHQFQRRRISIIIIIAHRSTPSSLLTWFVSNAGLT